MTDDLAKLIERLEAATGPDRELDEMIRVALGYPPKPWNYTSSIDSAVTPAMCAETIVLGSP